MKNTSDNFKTYGRSIFYGAIMGMFLALVFCAGFFLREFVDLPPALAFNESPDAEGYPLIDEVQTLIDAHYLREQPDYINRQYAAIRGLLASLEDRNTFFIEPPVARSEADVLAGTYGGIGVSLQRNEGGEFVLYPFEDSSALRAGVEGGDILIAVNGVELTLSEQQDAVDQMLRGEVADGNGVEITIARESLDEPLTLFIEYDVINVPSVLWRVLSEDARIGFIQILRFTNRTPDEIREAIAMLSETEIEAVVLDLRNNGGGLLQESINVASIFLNEGVVLYQVSADDERIFEADSDSDIIEFPLVILVNNGTASASELVAGALQDHARAILIGQTTYGKGTIQQIFTLSDGSSIHVTSAEWLTPDRNVIDGVGLIPDIEMIPDANGRDIELGEAVRYLQTQLQDEE